MDYSSYGFNSFGFNFSSFGNRTTNRITAMQRDLWERSPYLNPITVTRGTLLSTGGGVTQMQSSTGGTNLFTVDPVTGTVTISGGVIVNQTMNLGTAENSTFAGTIRNQGTFSIGIGTAGTIYNSRMVGGTLNNTLVDAGTVRNVYLGNGTAGILTFIVQAGSNILPVSGNCQVQEYGSAVCFAIMYGGTTFRFTPSGTI